MTYPEALEYLKQLVEGDELSRTPIKEYPGKFIAGFTDCTLEESNNIALAIRAIVFRETPERTIVEIRHSDQPKTELTLQPGQKLLAITYRGDTFSEDETKIFGKPEK